MRIRPLLIFSVVSSIVILVSCDLRSETAKKEMEKFESPPTPAVLLSPTPTPADPADIINIDTSVEGDLISANGHGQISKQACTKFNRLLVNGDDGIVTVSGVCRQIMINGDRNKITADAVMEFVLNGSDNIVKYSRFLNGKQPSVIENRPGNIIEKIPAGAATNGTLGIESLNEHNKRQRPLPKTEKRPRRRVEKLLHRSDDRLLS